MIMSRPTPTRYWTGASGPKSQLSWWDQSINMLTTTVTAVMVRSINQYVTNNSHNCHAEINQSICYQPQSQLSWWDQSINMLSTTVTAVMVRSINQYFTNHSHSCHDELNQSICYHKSYICHGEINQLICHD